MHREISYADQHFQQESQLSLYLLTGLLGLLLGADLWPLFAQWVATWGPQLPAWSNEVYGYRIALIAAVIGGARTLYGSLDSLLQGKLGADLALAIAAIAAILLREPLVAAEIVFIGMLGECLESITFERTQREVRKIIEVCPRRCWRLRDGEEERIFAADLEPGDVVVVKPGARIPSDGIVLEGRSSVDTSALTGESMPTEKGPGDEVLAGSLNQLGALTIESKRVAEHTVVGQVLEMTSRALQNKADVERTADRLARYFLPAVLGLTLITFLGGMLVFKLGWFQAPDSPKLSFWEATRLSAYPALSVLVVACPCALILATPAAVIAALGRLAGTGVLLKGGAPLERLATVNAFVFDKTGTLTEGSLELGDIVALGDLAHDEVLRIAASAEQQSEHLLAQLVLREAKQRELALDSVTEFLAHPGAGVEVVAGSSTILVGNRRLIEERGVPLPPEANAALDRLDASGQTGLLVARAEEPSQTPTLLGIVGVRDRVRPEAGEVLAQLRSLGIEDVAILTGDRSAVAHAVADPLGVTQTEAELLPQDKAEFVANWQAQGKRVAMVGDGINDAPALAQAEVGLAIGTGTDVAAEAGDIVFMGDPLRNLPLLVRLSRQTVQIIHQNIIWFAFVVNAIGIVVTAWLWPLLMPPSWYEESPIVAVVYHQIGSLAVLLNAMRLLWFERTTTSPFVQRWRTRLSDINAWMEKWLDVDEGLHWIGHQWKPILITLGVLLLLLYPVTGFTTIGPDEVGIVQRFGRPLPDDLDPGLHWTMPWPIDRVTKLRPQRARHLEIGYRVTEADGVTLQKRTWSSLHRSEGIRRVPEEAVMITGDGNLIEIQGTVRYSVADPRAFLFQVRKPEAILRSATESVLGELVATRSFAELLTADRQLFQEEALDRLKARLAEYNPPSLGLRIEGLALHDLHPPQEVVSAYHQVAIAMEKRDQRINRAEANAIRSKAQQHGKSLKLLREAEADRDRLQRLAKASKHAFLARSAARERLTWLTELALFTDAIADLDEGKSPEETAQLHRQRRADAKREQAKLNEFRLASEALADAMGKREKMLLDTTNIPSWLQLWLTLDPQRQSAIPPGFASPNRRELPQRRPLYPE